MSTTILETAIDVGPAGVDLEIPAGTPASDRALALVAFDAFTSGADGDEILRPGRYRFLIEDDGVALVGGRIS